EVRSGPAEDLYLFLELTVALLQLTYLRRFLSDDAGTDTVHAIGLLQPVTQARLGDAEVLRDLRDRAALTGNSDDITTELGGIGLGHENILPARTEIRGGQSQPMLGQTPPGVVSRRSTARRLNSSS